MDEKILAGVIKAHVEKMGKISKGELVSNLLDVLAGCNRLSNGLPKFTETLEKGVDEEGISGAERNRRRALATLNKAVARQSKMILKLAQLLMVYAVGSSFPKDQRSADFEHGFLNLPGMEKIKKAMGGVNPFGGGLFE